MFDIGDYIVYGNNGICQVEDITHPQISGIDNTRLYYVLIPEKTRESRLFCPAENSKVPLRKIITSEEAMQILGEAPDLQPLLFDNERVREERFKNIIKGCDCRELIQVIKALILRRNQREEVGKKITATDERLLKQAEEELYSELSLATGQDKLNIREIILSYCK